MMMVQEPCQDLGRKGGRVSWSHFCLSTVSLSHFQSYFTVISTRVKALPARLSWNQMIFLTRMSCSHDDRQGTICYQHARNELYSEPFCYGKRRHLPAESPALRVSNIHALFFDSQPAYVQKNFFFFWLSTMRTWMRPTLALLAFVQLL
jgi:hypothetical protein